MTLKLTAEIIHLQQKIAIRLAELGFTDAQAAANIAHNLAEIAVLGRSFAQDTLPLFLSLDAKHTEPLAQLIVSIKCDLEELGDSIRDSDTDVRTLMQFLNDHPTAQ